MLKESASDVILFEHGNIGLAHDPLGLDTKIVASFYKGQFAVNRSVGRPVCLALREKALNR
jgi:hypothetical protein